MQKCTDKNARKIKQSIVYLTFLLPELIIDRVLVAYAGVLLEIHAVLLSLHLQSHEICFANGLISFILVIILIC